jgi:bifunctional non-homologous end joining protein LigD
VFFAFDLLFLDGTDLRPLPLIERKRHLKKFLCRKVGRVLYVDHIERRGQELFQRVCGLDLEGIVAKPKKLTIPGNGEALA